MSPAVDLYVDASTENVLKLEPHSDLILSRCVMKNRHRKYKFELIRLLTQTTLKIKTYSHKPA